MSDLFLFIVSVLILLDSRCITLFQPCLTLGAILGILIFYFELMNTNKARLT